MNIDSLVDRILDSYEKYGLINRNDIENFPNRQNVVSVLQDLQSLILPGFKAAEDIEPLNIRFITGQKVNNIIAKLTREIQKSLIYTISKVKGNSDNIENSHCFKLAERTSIALIEEIPELRRKIQLDTIAAYNGDPAAHSKEEVILSYPGLEAIVIHRIANFLYKNGIPIIPRIMSEHVHGKTGIDIHPGATIGESFFIDHGTGVVIGETCVIGKNVKIYQGVTLGALSVKKELQDKKRHPTIEDNVTIYAGATILGGDTVIGKGCIIGGNTWVTQSVEEGTVITQQK
ncbi:MAG: serine acetyltransferase [Treponema sp.]|nr:serine acetyltransferase [Treponema bryantii]MBO5826678.1 serine acetyltransferase [Treponema sp.]MBQ7970101.1 serine acetyltransferase [Treponema sp.]MBR4998715.1 serine acetyltransferase [Clostridia bacterium]